VLILNGNLDEVSGLEKIREGVCDAVSFGRLYIPNPDLAERIVNGWEIERKQEMAFYYGSQLGAKGYVDYPFYQKAE
jgi:N-ethylmaleimide reductase